MVRSLILYVGILIMVLVSCQKETSFELGKPARGSLQGSGGDCLPKVVGGSFKQGKALGDTNYIDVTIDIAQIGNYTVYTDTTNGYSFKATGSTTSTGPITVRMKGTGTPTSSGIDNFTVHFDTTVCFVPISVAAVSSSGGSAVFTLNGSPGTCMNSVVSGTFTQGTALTAANKVNIEVNVTTVGTWSMTSTNVTGFSFAGSGNFTTTGVQTITLTASGTPTTAGSQSFSVNAGASSCSFAVTVAPSGSAGAVFTLQGSPGTCMNAVTSGTYTQGTALTSSNKVDIQVNVTTAGQWTVSTNTVAGMAFNNIGNFTATGVQTITLLGAGTPSASGVQTFTVTAGTSTCTFTITVNAGTPPTQDLFILTPNSWWSYDDGFSPGDTLKRKNIGTITANGFTYREFEEYDDAGTAGFSYYYRKDAATNFYYEYAAVDDYSVITFTTVVAGDILFLKENITQGATWNSTEWSGSDSTGPKKLRYVFNCTAANVTANVTSTAGTKTFNNVYKVTMKSQTAPGTSSTFTDEGLVWEYWYARGIGVIFFKGTLGSQNISWPIRNYQVF